MATEIDRRVVEMQFDNRDFEKNCKQSLSTLEKLKMALNFDGAKGLKDVGEAAKKVDLSNISKGAEEVRAKFSIMQVAGMTAISELTKGLLNFGKSIWNNTFGQMARGGMARTLKIDQARFQMKALANNFDEIAGDAEKLAYFMDQMHQSIDKAVSGTAYGYDAAAAVASQLMASGIKNTETMYNHLRAIAGAASMTGRSFEDIGNIFTTVASNGRLMTMQLRQFSSAGLNLSATLAKDLGKTEREINEMVTKGQISFEQFSEALYNAFGEAAGKADETWSGVTANVKAQLSRIGQIFTDPLVEKLIPVLASLKGVLKQVNTVLKPMQVVFRQVLKSITDAMKKTLDNFNVARFKAIANAIENIFASVFLVLTAVKDAFAEVFPKKTSDELYNAARNFELITQSLLPTRETLDGIKNTFKLLLIPTRLVYNLFRALSESAIKPIAISLLKFIGAIARLINTLEPFITALVNTIVDSKVFNAILLTIAGTIIIVINILTELTNVASRVFNKLFGNSATKQFLSGIQSIAKFIQDVIILGLVTIFAIIQKIVSYINADTIISIFEGIGNVLNFFIYLIQNAISAIGQLAKGASESGSIIGNVISAIKNGILAIVDVFKGEDASEHLTKIKEALAGVGSGLKKLINDILDAVKDIDVGKLMLIAFGMAIVFLIIQIAMFVRAGTLLVRSVDGIAGIFTKIKNAFLGVGRISPVAQLLFSLTLTIGTLTAALVTLSNDVDSERLKVAAAALGILVGVLMGFSIAMAKITATSPKAFDMGISSFIVMMASIAGSIWMLSSALKSMSAMNFNWDQFIGPLIAIIAMMAGMGAAIVIINKFSGPAEAQFTMGALAILAFSASIKILSNVLIALTDAGLYKKAADAITALIAIVGLLGTLAGAIAVISLAGGGIGSGMAMIGMALSLLILISVLKKLAAAPADQIRDGFVRLCLMCVPILAFIVAMGVLSKVAGTIGFLVGLGSTFSGLTLLLASLAAMVVILGSINGSTVLMGLFVVSMLSNILIKLVRKIIGTLATLNPATIAVAQTYMKNLKTFLIGLGAAMIMLSISAKIMNGVSIEAFAEVSGLLILLAAAAIIFTRVSKSTEHAKIAPIIAIIVAISALAGALAILSFQDPIKLLAAGGALSATLLAVMGVILALGKFSSKTKKIVYGTKQDFKIAKVVALIAGVTALILAVSFGLTKLFQETEKISSNDMAAQLAALAAANVDVSAGAGKASPSFWEKYGPLGVVLGASIGLIILFGLLYKWFDKIAKNSSGNIAQKLTMLITTFGIMVMAVGAITALSLVTTQLKDPGDIVMAAAGLAAVIAAFALVIKYMGKIPAGETTNMIKVATALVIASSAMVVLSVALLPLALAIHAGIVDWGDIIAGSGALALAIFAVAGAMQMIMSKNKGINKNAYMKAAIAMVIASSSLLIIAGAIGALAYEMKAYSVAWTDLIVPVTALAVLAVAVFVALGLITKINAKFTKAKVMRVAISMVIASSAILILAGAISLIAYSVKGLSVIGNSAFNTALIALGVAVAAVAGIMVLLTLFSSRIDATKLLLSCAAFGILAGSVSVIALAIAGLTSIAKNIDKDSVDKVAEIFNKVMICMSILMGLAGIAGTIFGLGFVAGILALAGAFAIFAAGIIEFGQAALYFAQAALYFAQAVQIIIDSFVKLNSVKLDVQTIRDNLRAFRRTIPQFVNTFTEIIQEMNNKKSQWAYAVTDMANALMINFLHGIRDRLPEVLEAFKDIMKDVGDFLGNEENQLIIYNFAVSLGETLSTVIEGIIDGLFDRTEKRLSKLQDKYVWNPVNATQERNRKINETLMGQETFLNAYSSEEMAKNATLFRAAVTNGAEDAVADLKKYNGIIALSLDLTEQQIAEIDKAAQKRRDNGIQDETVLNQLITTMKTYADINSLAYDSEAVLAYGSNLAKLTGIHDLYSKKQLYINRVLKDADNGIDSMADSAEDAANAAEESADKAANAAEKAADATEKAAEDIKDSAEEVEKTDIFSGIMKKGTELFGGSGNFLESLKEKAKSGLESFTGFFGNIGDAFGEELGISFGDGALENCDLTDFFNKVLNDGVTEADIAGLVAGERYANSFFKTQEEKRAFYYEQANKKVATNESAFSKKSYWATLTDEKGNQLYKSADDYVNKQMELDEKYDATSQTLNGLGHAYDDVAQAMEEFDIANDKTGDSMDETKDKAKNLAKTLRDQVKDAMKNIFDDPGEEEFIDTDEMLYRMEENIRRVGKWASQLAQLAGRGISEGLLNELREMGPAGAAKVDAFARMTAEQLREANLLYQDSLAMPDVSTNKIVKAYKDAGFNASLGFSNGIDPDAANDAMTSLGTNSLNALKTELDEHSPSKKTEEMGEWATEGLAKGIGSTQMLSMVYHKAATASEKALKGYQVFLTLAKATDIAKNFCLGLTNGLTTYGQAVVTRATGLAAAIIKAFTDRLAIRSPSKVMYGIGEYIMQGLGIGMEDGSTFVERQTSQTADDIVEAMKENMIMSLDGLSEDGVYSPVIRPIFDMSLMGEGWNDITSWFNNGQTIDLNSNIARLTPTERDDTSSNEAVINAIRSLDVSGVKNEIQSMRNDISNLEAAMSNLKVVMNTGALVGQLMNPMDAAMGQKAMLNSRGRY